MGPPAHGGPQGETLQKTPEPPCSPSGAQAQIALRPYQTDLIRRIDAAIAAGHRRVLAVLPTGTGKTVIFSDITGRDRDQGARVLILAHRRELVAQAARKLWDGAGIDAGIIQAGIEMRLGEPVQIASVQTLHARAVRSRKIDLPPADLVVVDEAHHVRARTWQSILDAYPDATVLGFTATPCRGDGRGLGNVFDCIVEGPPVVDLINQGFLVPTRVYAPSQPDLDGVRVARGDYVEAELAERMDRAALVGDVVDHWCRLAEGRRTVVFATSVAHSVHVRDEFRRAGVMAEHIDGSTPTEERERILAGLADGSVEVVTNCMVLTEGFDLPELGAIVLARPTRHHGLFRQMIGRGLRPAPGKDHALVLDHAGATFLHGFVEEPVAWTLDEDRRAVLPTQAARAEQDAPRLTTCPECKAIRRTGQPCPACGWRPTPRARAVDVRDGDLARLDRDGSRGAASTFADQMQFFSELLGIARERGFKPGWAAHKYKEKHKRWPPVRAEQVEPVAPSAATRSWVKSRQIAWARARDRAAAR